MRCGERDLPGRDGESFRRERASVSFFESVPGGADLHLLKHILHDWSDDECVTILRHVREARASDPRVVVVEMLVTNGGSPSPAPLSI